MSAFAEFRMPCPCPCQGFLGKPPDHIGMFADYSFQPGGKAHAHPAFRQTGKDHRVMDFGDPGQAKSSLQANNPPSAPYTLRLSNKPAQDCRFRMMRAAGEVSGDRPRPVGFDPDEKFFDQDERQQYQGN